MIILIVRLVPEVLGKASGSLLDPLVGVVGGLVSFSAALLLRLLLLLRALSWTRRTAAWSH